MKKIIAAIAGVIAAVSFAALVSAQEPAATMQGSDAPTAQTAHPVPAKHHKKQHRPHKRHQKHKAVQHQVAHHKAAPHNAAPAVAPMVPPPPTPPTAQ